MLNTKELIGLEVCQAAAQLEQAGITNFKFVYYTDRRQVEFDKEIVTAANFDGDTLKLIVCRYKFDV